MKVVYHPFRYVDQIPPHGNLVDHPACHALWYYYTKAQRLWEETGKGNLEDQIILERDLWRDLKPLRRMFRSTAKIYNVDPNAMERYWPAVAQEAERLGFPIPGPRIRNPFTYLSQGV